MNIINLGFTTEELDILNTLAKKENIILEEYIIKLVNKKTKTRYFSEYLTQAQIEKLKEDFPKSKNVELVNKYKINLSELNRIRSFFKLEKDAEWALNIKQCILKERNKNMGRDLSYDFLKKEALKYETRVEFQIKDPSAYTTANRLGIMKEITQHMVSVSFSIPQIITRQITEYLLKSKCEYNTRKIITPYELDIYFPDLRIAFEYDGKGWHTNDTVDKISLCKSKNILLIKLKERSRRYKEDIQNHLIENIDLINSWCNISISEKDILCFNEPIEIPKLFNKEEEEILKNNTEDTLKKEYSKLFNKYKKYKSNTFK